MTDDDKSANIDLVRKYADRVLYMSSADTIIKLSRCADEDQLRWSLRTEEIPVGCLDEMTGKNPVIPESPGSRGLYRNAGGTTFPSFWKIIFWNIILKESRIFRLFL
jgi:hypothetical protein